MEYCEGNELGTEIKTHFAMKQAKRGTS